MDSLATPRDFSVEDNGHVVVKTAGKTAYVAFSEGSDNAAVRLTHVMTGASFLIEKEKAYSRSPDQGFADCYREGMDIGFEDGLSGRLTLVGGMARMEGGWFIWNFNIHYPVTADAEVLVRQMSAMAGTYGWTLAWNQDDPPYVIDPEGPVVKELMSLCCQVLGAETEACSMDGDTYARKLPNMVTFGPGIRRQEKPCPPGHGDGQPDKCVKVENLTSIMETYIGTLRRPDVLVGG